MPVINTFWKAESGKGGTGQISVTGKDLPKIERVVLAPSDNTLKDGDVTRNFTVTSGGFVTAVNTFTGFTNDKIPNPAVKGILEIHYEGFDSPQRVSITMNIKDIAPKLTLSPATQTINTNHGFSAVFGLTGGVIDSVVPVAGLAGNKHIDGSINNTDSGFTITLKDSVPVASTNAHQLHVWLAGANKPILVKPTVKTSGAPHSYNLSATTVTLNSALTSPLANGKQTQTVTIIPSAVNAPVPNAQVAAQLDKTSQLAASQGITVEQSATDRSKLTVSVPNGAAAGLYKFNITPSGASKALVLNVKVESKAPTAAVTKVGKGNIDLLDQKNTMLVYSASVKNAASPIWSVRTAQAPSVAAAASGHGKFVAALNTDTGQIEIRTRANEDFQKGASYKMRLEFTLVDGSTVYSGDITIKPAHSAVKHSIPAITHYQSRTGVENHMVVDIKPVSPGNAKIETLVIKANGNPGDAYWYHYDKASHKLHLWVKDGAAVKPGKQTLVFSVTYKDQAFENIGTKAAPVMGPKPVDLKVPVTIVR